MNINKKRTKFMVVSHEVHSKAKIKINNSEIEKEVINLNNWLQNLTPEVK